MCPAMRIVLIVNPVAGGHRGPPARLRRQAGQAVASLRQAGADAQVWWSESRGHATRLAASAVEAGADVVAAWGGDGTVNEVAAVLAGAPAALAIVPAGSGSGLARALGVPLAWRGALDLAIGGTERVIDAGSIGGRFFVNVAGLGLDAHIASVFNADRDARPGRRGLAAYLRITLRELFRYRAPRVRVAVDGDSIHEGPALLVALANSSQYGNGARIAPAARLDDGLVDVVAVRATSPVRDLLRARRLFDGTIARDGRAAMRRGARVRVEAAEPLLFHTDGEPHAGGTVLDAEVIPAAIRVRVPVTSCPAMSSRKT